MRSSEWFAGNDETAVSHRVVMRSVGLEVPANNDKPIIGIADSSSDLNPCNLPLRALVDDVKAELREIDASELSEHSTRFEALHGKLQEALSTIDGL